MKLPLYSLILAAAAAAQPASLLGLELQKGDHVAIVGSGLADRQQHFGWLESLIHKANSGADLTVRNLGFAADEINVRPRSADAPTTEYFLSMKPGDLVVQKGDEKIVYKSGANFGADVLLAYWGFNESFKGEAGLEAFKKELDAYLKTQKAAKYNGESAPRIVLFSPIAHEDLKSADFPDGRSNNKNLALYTAAMAEVAKANQVEFVDLFKISQELYASSSHPLTFNGIHLTDEGDKLLAEAQFKALFGKDAPKADDPAVAKIREAVLDKNKEWHHRYRTVDQFNIFGQRSRILYKDASDPNNPGVDNAHIMGQELAQRDVKTANRDKAVWAAAKGQAYEVKDDNLPPIDATPANREPAVPYMDPVEAIKHLKHPEGTQVDFIASEKEFPELVNPVQMNFDTKGRLWIAAWTNYPETAPTTKSFDKLLVFDIDPKTGKFTQCTTFLDGLNCPTGFQFYKDGVILIQSPDLWFVRDTDGDGKADWKERILHGLDAADSHHETNSICYEPGGALYLSDGVFHRSNVETTTGPVRNIDGAIYRFEPRTGKFERYAAYGFANPHGRVFDYWGNDIITDATGNANYFAPAFSGFISEPNKHPSMKQFWDRPSRPTPGTAILSSRHFPEAWQGQFLNANVISFQGIFRAQVSEEGSGLRADTIEALVETDIAANPNFRPSGMAVAPDGSIYFMDWSQMLIGHLQHHLRDPLRDHQHGRIYRITYPSRPLLEVKKISGEPLDKLVKLLEEPENDVRLRAKIEMGMRESKDVIAAVNTWVNGLDKSQAKYEHNVLEALWVHQWHNVVDLPLLERVLSSPEPRARAQGVRVLGYWRDRVPQPLEVLKKAIVDAHPRVRLEAIRVLSFFNGDDALPAMNIAYDLLKNDTDYYLEYTFKETLRQLQGISGEKTLPADPALLATLIGKLTDAELNSLPSTEPVLYAKLERKSYDLAARDRFIKELRKIRKTGQAEEIIANLERLDAQGNGAQAATAELGKLLVSVPAADLLKVKDTLIQLASNAKLAPVRKAAWAGVILADGNVTAAWDAAKPGHAQEALIQAISILPNPALRVQFQDKLSGIANSTQGGTLRAIHSALPLMGVDHAAANFAVLAKHVIEGKERSSAANAINQLPRTSWAKDQATPIAESILAYAKTVPTDKRTQQDYVELTQLGVEMATLADNAALRKELRGLGVAVFVVKTLHEQLKFDTTRLVVEKGKPFELIFENTDVMPHNLVIVDPGKHTEFGMAAQTMGPNDNKDKEGRTYLPKGHKFIDATRLLEPGEKQTLKVKAPNKEGAYEFVCTFPGHWMIMWGQLIVTSDVDDYLAKNPHHTLPALGAPTGH